MASVADATFIEKISVIPQLAIAISAGFLRILTRPLSSGPKPKTLFKDAAYTTLRTLLGLMSIGQEQWLNKTTESVYRKFVQAKGWKPKTTTLPSGLKIHWFGDQDAQKTIVFFHGGGYVLAASDGHIRWASELCDDLSQTHSVNIMVPEYTLAPHGQYPVQLKEAAEALHWLIETQRKSPKDIIVAGDSAGGNLSLALLLHILRPHPDVPTKITLSEPLTGAVLISPWINFATDYDSLTRNAASDYIGPGAGARWSSLFMGSASRDNYNQPFFAEKSWFKGFDKVVSHILVWGGGGELIIDSIEGMAKKLDEVHPSVQTVVEPGVAHEDFIMEATLGYKEKAEGTKVVEDWISAKL